MKTDWSSDVLVRGLAKAEPSPHYYYLAKALRTSNTLLEVGTGPGILLRYLMENGFRNYTGADLTMEMLAETRKVNPDVPLIETDVMDMSNFEDNSYDWVVCADVLIHIPRPYEALENLWRVARGGLVLVVRSSDYPDDLVDISKSFQEISGKHYFYNIFNSSGFPERLNRLSPRPKGISSYHTRIAPHNTTNVHIDQSRYPVWSAAYAILKDPKYVQWQGEGCHVVDHTNIFNRFLRKARRLAGAAYSWE